MSLWKEDVLKYYIILKSRTKSSCKYDSYILNTFIQTQNFDKHFIRMVTKVIVRQKNETKTVRLFT